MKKLLFVFIFLLVVPLVFVVDEADAFSIWQGKTPEKNSSWWVAGSGAGNINFSISYREDYTYTYRYELSYHQGWSTYYQPYPYSVTLQFANRYYQSGNYLNMIANYEWGTAKQGVIIGGLYQASGGGNYKGIVGYPGGSQIKLDSRGQAYVKNSYGSAYGDLETSYLYFP